MRSRVKDFRSRVEGLGLQFWQEKPNEWNYDYTRRESSLRNKGYMCHKGLRG